MSPLDRRQVLRLLGAAGAAGATAPVLAACSTTSQAGSAQQSPVRIGLVIPKTGPGKAIGDELNAGFQLYLKLHGEQLGGRAVQLSTEDEGTSADSGRAAVDRLLKGSVHALSGVVSSAVMSAISDHVESAQVPLLGSAASPGTLGTVKYIWRTSYVNTDPGTALGGYLGGKTDKALIVADDSSTSQEQVNAFTAAFNGILHHPELAGTVRVPNGGSFTAAFDAIRTGGVRNVFACFSGDGAAAFLKAYRSAGLNVRLHAPGFMTEGADSLQRLGDPAMGLYTAMNYGPDLDNPANRMFAAEYQRIYGNPPSTYAMASYDAAAVLAKAVVLAGADLSPQALNTALSGVGALDSPRGAWQFNQSRTPLQRWYLRQVRKDGQVTSNTVLGDIGMLG